MAFLQHTLGIFINPTKEWHSIRAEQSSFKQVFLSHVPFLALIPSVASYFGVTQVGWSIGDGDPVRLTAESAMSLAALTYFALLAGVFVLGEFINWMARTYGVSDTEERRHYEGTALAVYVCTPLFFAGLFAIYPDLWLNAVAMLIAGSYSVYLIYAGIPILMNIDKDRAFLFASSVVTIGLVLMVLTRVGSVLLWGLGIGPVYVD